MNFSSCGLRLGLCVERLSSEGLKCPIQIFSNLLIRLGTLVIFEISQKFLHLSQTYDKISIPQLNLLIIFYLYIKHNSTLTTVQFNFSIASG